MPAPTVTLRRIAPSVFLPALVYEIGDGAIAPIIPLTATSLGAGPATAAYLLALLGVGRVLGDVPASALADRIGDRRSMIVAAALTIVALLDCFFCRSLVLLALGLVLIGMANATFYLARQAYLTEVAPAPLRARAMSTLGGSHRVGLFIGPFVGALAISATGLRAAYLVAVVTSAAVIVLLLAVPDVEITDASTPAVRGATTSRRMFLDHRRLFLTLGIAVLAVGAVRAARQTVLPLWSEHIGLDAATTSIVFGIASAVDMALFYPSGKVMDRFGRLAIAVPSMAVLGGSMMLLPLTHGVVSLAVVAMVMSFGNGIGSGIMMTLGADVAPREGRIRFLSVWRVLSDTGNAAGPVIVSIVAGAATLALGIVSVGAVGLLAAAGLGRWAPPFSAWATPAMAREQRRVAARQASARPDSVTAEPSAASSKGQP